MRGQRLDMILPAALKRRRQAEATAMGLTLSAFVRFCVQAQIRRAAAKGGKS